MSLTYSFSKLFKDLGLHPRSVSTAFGCRVNLAICLQVEHLTSASSWMDGVSASMVTCSPCPCCDWLQGTSGPDPTTVYVDMRALRHDRYKSTDQPEKHENNSKGTFNKTPTGQEKATCGVINSCVCSRVRLVEKGSPHSLPLMESGKVSLQPLPPDQAKGFWFPVGRSGMSDGSTEVC